MQKRRNKLCQPLQAFAETTKQSFMIYAVNSILMDFHPLDSITYRPKLTEKQRGETRVHHTGKGKIKPMILNKRTNDDAFILNIQIMCSSKSDSKHTVCLMLNDSRICVLYVHPCCLPRCVYLPTSLIR